MKKVLVKALIIVAIYFAPLFAAADWLLVLVRFRKLTPYWPRLALYWKQMGATAWQN